MRVTLLVLTLLLLIVFVMASRLRLACPTLGNLHADSGWVALRAGRSDEARRDFEAARARCPDHAGALTGLGYLALRKGQERAARKLFDRVLDGDSSALDALVGRGIVAWRAGDYPLVYDLFHRVLRIHPNHAEARAYLAQLPEGMGPAPRRPPLVLPDTLVYGSRAVAGGFQVRSSAGWAPFYVKGVNLGAALPGKHPSEFPDSATYAAWIGAIGELGANAIRVYTIHPPRFYAALRDYNQAHRARPLWLIHGVWAELPPRDDYDDAAWKGGFQAEMRHVVDLLHGRADIPPRPGHTGGHYTADVSPWTLAYIIGREWEPHSVEAYMARHPLPGPWAGKYLRVAGGNVMDVWLAQQCDYLIAYEVERYRAQRPVAYTNWPTLDPLHHITESTAQEEAALRKQRGETATPRSSAFADDAVTLDASLVTATAAYPAGYFASYHIYPYAPDFMVLDPGYARARSPWGPSSYFGYLQDLKRHHARMPVLVSEYGVPASFGIAHLQLNGWHHGGHAEAEAAALDARMTREIAAAGMAGGIVFEWIDEWFKKTWLTRPFAIPLDRNRLWLNVMDPEQRYGVLALDAGPARADAPLAERLPEWRARRPLYEADDGTAVRAYVDAAYLRLLWTRGKSTPAGELLVGFDVSRPDAGAFRWPGRVAGPLPVGVEYVLRVGDDVRMLATPAANPFYMEALPGTGPLARLAVQGAPPGLFSGRWRYHFNFPLPVTRAEDGAFEPLRVLVNAVRLARDGTEYPALGYDRGVLRRGPAPGGLWETADGGRALEVRIPWTLLGVTDPSARRVLQVGGRSPREIEEDDALATEIVPGIRVVAAWRGPQGWLAWPASDRASDVALMSWSTWEKPTWHSRRRPTFEALRQAFAALDSTANLRPVALP